ncbi:hypothetical protein Ancab_012734 [Ancistrocladus abbreviatus]
MDGDGGLNMRNWGYYEPPLKTHHLGLQLMTSMDRKPLLGGRDSAVMANANGSFYQRDCGVTSGYGSAEYMNMNHMREWMNRGESKFYSMMPSTPSYSVLTETSTAHPPVQMLRQPESSSDERVARPEGLTSENNNGPLKKRSAGKSDKAPKSKKSKKAPNKDGGSASVQRAKSAKKTTEVVINGIDMDISSIPIPVCSCTGSPQQCYRWGSGGWQSACCTTGMSMYPLPMSTKRRGARIAGRKMSLGAFKKVLEKLAAEGYNFSNPIDLRTHWAKHGTNKFVTIR